MKAPCREVGPFQRSPAQVPSRKDFGGASLCRKGRVRVLSSGKSRDAEDDECGEETYPRKFWKNKIVGRGFGFDSMDGVPAALRAGSLQRGPHDGRHLHPYQSQFPSVRKNRLCGRFAEMTSSTQPFRGAPLRLSGLRYV